ncbi:hypothetical protein J1605_005529 [Eschrichtius robustus]|uniref:Fibronectin type-III domain-containing protein n=1 Tax=Eschrichtius robustus TaxID=9764 RepID=A0AB34HBA9_ESCRO|nr:hypothetical protein J1605_005529 [Eschrichtius robustus]
MAQGADEQLDEGKHRIGKQMREVFVARTYAMAELRSCDRDHMAGKAKHTYCPALYGTSVPAPVLGPPCNLQTLPPHLAQKNPPSQGVCSSPPIHMKVQPLNQTALQVSWNQPETIYHPPIMNYMISYSWTKNEDEKEKTFTKDSDKDLKATISPVSPDSLYLFRVQAVCRNDMRSDFSQTMLFQGA